MYAYTCILHTYICTNIYQIYIYIQLKCVSIFNTFILKDGMYIYTRTYIYMIVLCFLVWFLWVLRSESLGFTSWKHVCVCVCVHSKHHGVMVSVVSPFSILLSQSLGFVSWVHACVCVYIHACACVYTHTCAHSVCMWRDVRMQMHVLVHAHTSRHASMCMHVCMCALPTAAWLAPDPSYAAGREDASLDFRFQRAYGHGACAAGGGRDCRRQKQGTGRPTLWMCVCMFED